LFSDPAIKNDSSAILAGGLRPSCRAGEIKRALGLEKRFRVRLNFLASSRRASSHKRAMMTRKTAWLYKLDPSEGIDLTIRLEQIGSSERPEMTCQIELSHPSVGKSTFQITKKLFQRLKEGAEWLKESPLPNNESVPSIQTRCEDEKSGLVLMREVPAFANRAEIKIQYKLGDGAGFDYAFQSLETLDSFLKQLERAVSAKPQH
jgi:hypothetical protein